MADIVVCGGGTMGAGIAHSFLQAGRSVFVKESDQGTVETAIDRIRASLLRSHRPSEDPERATAEDMAQLDVGVNFPDGKPDVVVEAVPERPDLKAGVLTDLARAYPDSLLVSNTSSLSIDSLAASVSSPERFLGMHFFNPVPVSQLIELVTGSETSSESLDAASRIVDKLGKTAIVVRDSPGFATSRLGLILGLEAIRMVADGVATARDIDTAMELGYRHPMGPLKLTDLVGLDVRLGIAEYLAETLGPRFEPPDLLRSLVAEGKLGRKSGEGFYPWS